MFDALNSFWGGMVTFAGGLITIFTLIKIVSTKPRLLAFDFRGQRFNAPKLPEDFTILYMHDGKNFKSLHRTEIIIKNETGLPITDDTFLSPPMIEIGETSVCAARQVSGIDDSRGAIKVGDQGKLILHGLMVPIDSSITFEIVSEDPINQTFQCIHRDARCIRRNYANFTRVKSSLIVAPIIAVVFTLVLTILLSVLGAGAVVEWYGRWMIDGIMFLGLPQDVAAIFFLLHLSLLSFLSLFTYRWFLSPSEAEVRFSDLKVGSG